MSASDRLQLIAFTVVNDTSRDLLGAAMNASEKPMKPDDAFFRAFVSQPCTRCGGKRDWSLDGQLQAVCYDCGHPQATRQPEPIKSEEKEADLHRISYNYPEKPQPEPTLTEEEKS